MLSRVEMDEEGFKLGDAYIGRIHNRLHKENRNWVAVICGETGSGKSYSALTLAHKIGGKVYIVFKPVEFLSILNSNHLQKGDVLVFDEAGVGMAAREWYSLQNKLLGAVLQTFRHRNVATIFTCPNLSFIDVQARKLFHAYLETQYIDREREIAVLKPYDIQTNSMLNKDYFKFPRFVFGDRIVQMNRLCLAKPDPEIIEDYEKRKCEYTARLNADALKALTGKKEEVSVVSADNDDAVVKQVLDHKDEYVKVFLNGKKRIDRDLIQSSLKITRDQAMRIKKRVEKEVFQKKDGKNISRKRVSS